jgi:hypothetical protein
MESFLQGCCKFSEMKLPVVDKPDGTPVARILALDGCAASVPEAGNLATNEYPGEASSEFIVGMASNTSGTFPDHMGRDSETGFTGPWHTRTDALPWGGLTWGIIMFLALGKSFLYILGWLCLRMPCRAVVGAL